MDFITQNPFLCFTIAYVPLMFAAYAVDRWIERRRRDRALYADSERQQRAVRRWRDRK